MDRRQKGRHSVKTQLPTIIRCQPGDHRWTASGEYNFPGDDDSCICGKQTLKEALAEREIVVKTPPKQARVS